MYCEEDGDEFLNVSVLKDTQIETPLILNEDYTSEIINNGISSPLSPILIQQSPVNLKQSLEC